MQFSLPLFFCCLSFVLCNTYYVSSTGNDTNNGTLSFPVATFEAVFNLSVNESATNVSILISPGFYSVQPSTFWNSLNSFQINPNSSGDISLEIQGSSSSFFTFFNISQLIISGLTFYQSTPSTCSDVPGEFLSLDSVSYGNISNTLFLNGCSNENGGAVSISDSSVDFSECTMENNTATMGGALNIYSSNVSLLSDNYFIENTASNGGGAVLLNASSELLLHFSLFSNNTATGGKGGAILSHNSYLNGSYANFFDNQASFYLGGSGGAIAIINDETVSFTQPSNFYQFNFTGNIGGLGGAISLYGRNGGVDTMNFSSVLFIRNEALHSGAAVYLGSIGGSVPPRLFFNYNSFECNFDKGFHYAPIRAWFEGPSLITNLSFSGSFVDNSCSSIGPVTCDSGLEITPEYNEFVCTPCGQGNFSIANSSTCVPCAIGQYTQEYGSGSCSNCPADTFTNSTGTISCQNCPPFYLSDPGSTFCPIYAPLYYIAGLTGNDSNIGNQSFPFKTMAKAISEAENGLPSNSINYTISLELHLSELFVNPPPIVFNSSFSSISLVSPVSNPSLIQLFTPPQPLFAISNSHFSITNTLVESISTPSGQSAQKNGIIYGNLFNNTFSVENCSFSDFSSSPSLINLTSVDSFISIVQTDFTNNSVSDPVVQFFANDILGTSTSELNGNLFLENSITDPTMSGVDLCVYNFQNITLENSYHTQASFNNFESPATRSYQGGSLHFYESNFTLEDCHFQNYSSNFGGVVFSEKSNGLISNSEFSNNAAQQGSSIGVGSGSGSLTVTQTQFSCMYAIDQSGTLIESSFPISLPSVYFPFTHIASNFTQNGCPYFPQKMCPTNTGSNASTGNLVCLDCDFGYGNSNFSDICSSCVVGQFDINPTGCGNCSSGYYSTNPSVGCLKCPAGSYSDISRAVSCKHCPSGTFSSKDGSTKCEICKSPNTVSDDRTQCLDSTPHHVDKLSPGATFGIVVGVFTFILGGAFLFVRYRKVRAGSSYLRVDDSSSMNRSNLLQDEEIEDDDDDSLL